jgi:hypothetical protein
MSILTKLAVGSLAVVALFKLQKARPAAADDAKGTKGTTGKRKALAAAKPTAAKVTRRKSPAKANSKARRKSPSRSKPTV